jgi:hypothetical protein
MSIQSQYEREEDDIQRRYDAGEIGYAEMRTELRDLQRDYAGTARESAQNAYDDELEGW